jgi:hypothetical protein
LPISPGSRAISAERRACSACCIRGPWS